VGTSLLSSFSIGEYFSDEKGKAQMCVRTLTISGCTSCGVVCGLCRVVFFFFSGWFWVLCVFFFFFFGLLFVLFFLVFLFFCVVVAVP